jgi:hypothetical protein
MSSLRSAEVTFRDSMVAQPCRGRINAVVRRSLSRDSFYFLAAALSLAVLIGWLSFVTIAART